MILQNDFPDNYIIITFHFFARILLDLCELRINCLVNMNNNVSIVILICFILYFCEAKKTIPGCGWSLKEYYLRANGIAENPKKYKPDLIPEGSEDRETYVKPKKMNEYKPIKPVNVPRLPNTERMNYGYNCRKFRERKCFNDG